MNVQIMEVERAPAGVADLLSASRFKPWRCMESDQGPGLAKFWSDSVADKLANGSQGLLAMVGESVVGLLVCSANPWETPLVGASAGVIEHFVVMPHSTTMEIAPALLDHALRDAAARGIGFLLGRCYTDDVAIIQAFHSRGFHRSDTLLDCFHDAAASPIDAVPLPDMDPAFSFRQADAHDRGALRSLAGKAFQRHFGRFHSDARIGGARATRIYEQWLDSALSGYADWLDVAEIDGRIVGCSCWRKPAGRERELPRPMGHYSICGIDPDYHGRGLFTALTYRGMQRMSAYADVVEGPTHVDNHGVQAAYSKLNWRVGVDARHSFHKWLD